MHDLVIRGGNVVDGTGSAPRTADVAVSEGVITHVGRVDGPARRVIDADGLVVTPGFIDIHTHFDGQVTWDDDLTPSCWHGVTTAILGNCGVGFAPVRPDGQTELIEIMEGVEDIPGARSPKASTGSGRPSPSISTPSPPEDSPWTWGHTSRTLPSVPT